jgi:hypothetical protein
MRAPRWKAGRPTPGKPSTGDYLAPISRSAIDAPNQHDADYATLYRGRDFRRLTLNLLPEPRKK